MKKHRQKYNKFVVEGDKIATELLEQDRFQPELIAATPAFVETHSSLLKVHQSKLTIVDEATLKLISNLSTPNQVLVAVDQYHWNLDSTTVSQGLSLYLDGIRDPGNMGTIIRIADWFGLDHIFCSPDCVDIYLPKVVQAAMGAIFRVAVHQRPLEGLLQENPNWPAYGTVLDGESLYETQLPRAGLIVIGNESKGISPENLKLLPKRISIPPAKSGGAESLNAAVATGILCAFFRAQTS